MWVVLLACFGFGACLITYTWGFHLAYGRSSHFFSVRYLFDHSSLPRELIDICCYLRGVNASVACLVFFSIDSSLTVVVNVRALSGPFSPCCCLILFCFSYQCSDRMFGFMFYAPQLWGMFSPAAISRVIRSSLPLALSPMSLIKMWSFKCSVGILPLHRRSIRFRSPAGATVVGRPPLLLRTQVLRKVASLSLDSLDCLLAVA